VPAAAGAGAATAATVAVAAAITMLEDSEIGEREGGRQDRLEVRVVVRCAKNAKSKKGKFNMSHMTTTLRLPKQSVYSLLSQSTITEQGAENKKNESKATQEN